MLRRVRYKWHENDALMFLFMFSECSLDQTFDNTKNYIGVEIADVFMSGEMSKSSIRSQSLAGGDLIQPQRPHLNKDRYKISLHVQRIDCIW